MNITELARRLKIPTQQLKEELPKLGFDIGRRAIKIDDAVAEKVVKLWQDKQQKIRASQYVIIEHKLGDGTTPARAAREVELPPKLNSREFAALLGLPVTTIVGELFKNGVMASINEPIDFETASIIAEDLGFTTKVAAATSVAQEHKEAKTLADLLKEPVGAVFEPRAPVVVVMGHVDHGKTTLLDAIRSTNVAASESGAITQHIGAYQVETKGRKLTFLDTPGHEAFSAMRSRGGRLADIAVIVVAADDGLQPQTIEAIEIAQREKLPFVVAINKVDKETADIERVKKALAELNLLPEDWGGKTICVPISAKKNSGIPELLDMVLLLADIEKLQANPHRSAVGTIIESHLDKGEGPVATALVQAGTLKVGDWVVAGEASVGKVKAMRDFRGATIAAASPAMPVRVLGLKQVPRAGDVFRVVVDEAEVRDVIRKQVKYQRPPELTTTPVITESKEGEESPAAITLNIMLKTDVLGSREAIIGSLQELKTTGASVKVVRATLGSITEHDVLQAEAAQAAIFGFHVPLLPPAEVLARAKGVHAQTYDVIYDILDEAKRQLEAKLKPELLRNEIGEAQVLQIFKRGKAETIVGCRITRGVVRAGTVARVLRGAVALADLKVASLRIGKEAVGEVSEGGECGLQLQGPPLPDVGDKLEFYHEEVRSRTIS